MMMVSLGSKLGFVLKTVEEYHGTVVYNKYGKIRGLQKKKKQGKKLTEVALHLR